MSGYLFILLGAAALVVLAVKFKGKGEDESDSLAERIDAILPQTQCGQCGYPGCQPYAEAIVRGEADINQCPPGGAAGVRKLAKLLGREVKPLSALHGVEKPKSVAFIDENTCIGCTLCIQACPVDAIVGAAKQMHTVVPSLCTGCELCLPPCPVDCISMLPVEKRKPHYPLIWMAQADRSEADAARERFRRRQLRLESERQEKAARLVTRAALSRVAAEDPRRALIAAAIERARRQKEAVKPQNVENLSPAAQATIAAIEARRAGPKDS